MVSNSLFQLIPKQEAQIVLVLFLSFLIGLEREEQKAILDQYRFGGVRTFPLLGLFGYALCMISGGNLLLPSIGLAVVGLFMWQSYRHKLEGTSRAGMTTEISGLITYAIGALVWREERAQTAHCDISDLIGCVHCLSFPLNPHVLLFESRR